MEDVMEIRGGEAGRRRRSSPGTCWCAWSTTTTLVRRAQHAGRTGFVSSGTGTKPTPLSPREVERIWRSRRRRPRAHRLEFEEGDVVRIIVGPFADFTGTISEINVEQSKLKVMVNIFDRETRSAGFDQVAKA
jgi:transcription antitermination factor NusG